MSPIGRVFIVINLILAGAFVVMAGTFLQNQTNWKTQHDKAQSDLEQKTASWEATLGERTEQITNLDREVRAANSNLQTVTNERDRLADENQTLKGQLAELAADVKGLTTRVASMDDAINRSTEEAKQAMSLALESRAARDTALGEKEQSDTALAEAKRTIDDLESKLAEASGQRAALEQTVAENEALFGYIKTRVPGLLASAQPDLRGVVEQASGNICTVRVTTNPGAAEVRPGYTFALYRGDTYKGEAVITEVDGEFAFCKITRPVEGMQVAAGDQAATNVGL